MAAAWPLLVIVATACECGSDAVVVTTVNAVRTAYLVIPSAVKLGIALSVYHENSVDEGSFNGQQFWGDCSCYKSYDLHVLYPWLAAFAQRTKDSVWECAMRNADKPGAPKHSKALTAKAHFIFRKVAAVRHAALEFRGKVMVWADADVELRHTFDAEFLAFARSVDVATIYRFNRRELSSCDDTVERALPDTGFATFNLASNASFDFVMAWAAYYATTAASNARCLNDICVWERLLSNDELDTRSTCAVDEASQAASSLSPPGRDVDEFVASFVRRRPAVEGKFAMCPEHWRPLVSDADRRQALTVQHAANRIAKNSGGGDMIARYRIDIRRVHSCPGDDALTSPFHLYKYAVHAKGGDVGHKLHLANATLVGGEQERRLQVKKESRWRSFSNKFLSHPFDAKRTNLTAFFAAARKTKIPSATVVESGKSWLLGSFYETLVSWNASIGYPGFDPQRARATTGQPVACAVDPEALEFQLDLYRQQGCRCDGVRYKMRGNVGLGSELAALFKPMAAAINDRRVFHDPYLGRTGCNATLAECLGLLPLDRCAKHTSDSAQTAKSFSIDSPPVQLEERRHRSLFWQTSMLVAYVLRPREATLHRAWRIVEAARGGESTSMFAGHDYSGPRRRVLGVHVRRGDTCINQGADEIRRGKGRRCDGLDVYAKAARRMIAEYGFNALFLATDDPEVARDAKRNARRVFGLSQRQVVVANPELDRATLYNAAYYNTALKKLPAGLARKDASALLDDLFILAHCDGLLGKFTSNVFRLAFALSNAVKGGDCVTPYESLDSTWCADFGRRTGNSTHGPFLC